MNATPGPPAALGSGTVSHPHHRNGSRHSQAPPGISRHTLPALADEANILQAHAQQCDAFLVTPIPKAKLLATLRTLGLVA
jgi:hypothetical protein